MFRKYLAVSVVCVIITGCAQKEVNKLIAEQNVNSRAAFAAAMVAAASTPSQADDVAIAMAYAGGMGQQQLFRERDGVDYLSAFMPYFNLLIPLAYGNSSGDEKSSITAGRDVYIDSTRSGSTAYDVFSSDGSQSLISLGTETDIAGYACGSCSWNSLIEGSCSCN